MDREDAISPPPSDLSSVKKRRGRPRKDQSEKREKKPSETVEPTPQPNDNEIGQEVTGVVSATFEAGYLITVRIGNSNTTCTGVVFKQGNYIPPSSEIDVAPNVRRIETKHRSRNRRPRQRFSDGLLGTANGNEEYVVPGNNGSAVVTEVKAEGTDDNSETLSAEPLQIVRSDSVSSRSSSYMGRMSELLQALQRENGEGDAGR